MADLPSFSPARISGTWASHGELLPREINELQRQGVTPLALTYPHPIRAGYVCWMTPDRFEPESWAPHSRKAERAFLFLVRDGSGDAVDVVAWAPQTERIGTWLGRAWALGEETAYSPRLGDGLHVHRSPLSWLQCGRRGVVFLRAQAAALSLLDAGPLVAEDIEHGIELRDMLTIAPPRILVRTERRRAA